ncbi:MAG: peptidase U32 family protein [Candidatus Thorarchaeota archaeon]
MTINIRKPELVAPVQDWKSLYSLDNLADAIYFGIKKFNMRIKAINFDVSELKDIVDYCHNKNPSIKAYLTTNILVYDNELHEIEELLTEAKKVGIDAIIAHDLAVIKFAKEKGIKFHISTQANVSNVEAAKFYENIGADRIVLARELSLPQIKLVKHHLLTAKIETFVHGSMCTSISGRCYFSASICDSEEFSANRGNCVQPCRREWRVFDDESNEFLYDGQMFLNAKDLCMIEYIPELIKANIDAFKIEGRMKNPLYIETVTRCYREAIEAYFNGAYTKERISIWLEQLSKVYNRGFHTGFYFKRPTAEDLQLERRGSISPYSKLYLGKILSFDKGSKTANILVEIKDFNLKLGDEIIILGEESYHHQKITHMVYQGKKIKNIYKKRSDNPFKINMRIKKEVQPEDKIYIIYK